jgi:UDP:flavonoid glycosyltransferase YjiC (YdhE family)
MPAVGHVNPILLTAAKLVESGYRVWWHSGVEVKAKIEATGARLSGTGCATLRVAGQPDGFSLWRREYGPFFC